MEWIIRELRFGLRALAARPGFTASVAVTLSIGIGATTAIFSVINSVLLRPAPYPQPDQLVSMFVRTKESARGTFLPAEFTELRAAADDFQAMAGYSISANNLEGAKHAVRVKGLSVTPDFFRVLGITPFIGPGFPEGDESSGASCVVLAYALWHGEFDGDPSIVGRIVKIDEEPFTVVGVMPADFRFIEDADAFTPASLTPTLSSNGTLRITPLRVLGRLKEGATPEQAEVECTGLVHRLPSIASGERGITVVSLHRFAGERVRGVLLLLFAAVGLMLLIACANAAGLILVRNSARRGEMAMRVALGAGIGRIAGSLLSECLLLSTLGGAGGLLFAFWGTRALPPLLPPDVPILHPIRVDSAVFVFAVLVSVLAGVALALAPLARLSTVELLTSLRAGPQSSRRAPSLLSVRGALMMVQVAVTLVLLINAGALTSNIVRLLKTDLGFDPSGLVTFGVSLPQSYSDKRQILSFYQESLRDLAASPGITGACVVDPLPFGGGDAEGGFRLRGQPSPSGELVSQSIVSRDYFQVMGIKLIRGRRPSNSEGQGGRGEAVVDESFARQFLSGVDPIGQQISVEQDGSGQSIWLDMVGVVADVRQESADARPGPEIYLPIEGTSQRTRLQNMAFVVRTATPTAQVAAYAQSAVDKVDHNVPVFATATVEQLVAKSMASQRTSMLLVGLFAVVATIMSFIGIYGITSQIVAERTAEIGIRIALGARRGIVLRLILTQGLMLVATGIGAGTVIALICKRVVMHWLFISSASDLAPLALAPSCLFLVAALACYLSARRATAVDPAVALRC
jgi:putative ABC transport system permease protein